MIDIDTEKIKECGNDIVKLSNDLNQIIENLYERIINMPTKTGEWQGNSAIDFSRRANIEKNQAISLKNCLYDFGLTLIENADKYNNEVNNTIL